MALSNAEKDQIVEERLRGVPVMTVAKRMNRSHTTVVKVFREWLEATAEDRADEIESIRATLVQRHEQAAFTAKAEGERARQNGDSVAHSRYLKEERESLREIARLTGADLPVKVQVSGSVDVNVRDPRERLAEYLLSVCPSSN